MYPELFQFLMAGHRCLREFRISNHCRPALERSRNLNAPGIIRQASQILFFRTDAVGHKLQVVYYCAMLVGAETTQCFTPLLETFAKGALDS